MSEVVESDDANAMISELGGDLEGLEIGGSDAVIAEEVPKASPNAVTEMPEKKDDDADLNAATKPANADIVKKVGLIAEDPCMCRLCQVNAKIGKTGFCRTGCRKIVESAEAGAKTKGQQHFDYLKQQEQQPVKTQWRIMIYVHERETNGDNSRGKGGRKKVAGYDFIFYKEMWETSKVIQKGSKLIALNKSDWIKWQVENKDGVTAELAVGQWEKYEKDRLQMF